MPDSDPKPKGLISDVNELKTLRCICEVTEHHGLTRACKALLTLVAKAKDTYDQMPPELRQRYADVWDKIYSSKPILDKKVDEFMLRILDTANDFMITSEPLVQMQDDWDPEKDYSDDADDPT